MCERRDNETLAFYALRYLAEHTAEAFIVVAIAATYFVYQDFKELSKSQIEVNTQILLEMQSINTRLDHIEHTRQTK